VVKIEKDGSGLNVKTIAGETIFGEKSAMDSRTKIVDELNAGQLDGIIMTAELGACGYNIALSFSWVRCILWSMKDK
jgi:hypothetical protein